MVFLNYIVVWFEFNCMIDNSVDFYSKSDVSNINVSFTYSADFEAECECGNNICLNIRPDNDNKEVECDKCSNKYDRRSLLNLIDDLESHPAINVIRGSDSTITIWRNGKGQLMSTNIDNVFTDELSLNKDAIKNKIGKTFNNVANLKSIDNINVNNIVVTSEYNTNLESQEYAEIRINKLFNYILSKETYTNLFMNAETSFKSLKFSYEDVNVEIYSSGKIIMRSSKIPRIQNCYDQVVTDIESFENLL